MIYNKYKSPKDKPNYGKLINYSNVILPKPGIIAISTKQFSIDIRDLNERYPNLVKCKDEALRIIISDPLEPLSFINNRKQIWEPLIHFTNNYNNLLISENSRYRSFIFSFAIYEDSYLNYTSKRTNKDIGLRLVYETYVDIKEEYHPTIIFTNLDFHEYRESGYSL